MTITHFPSKWTNIILFVALFFFSTYSTFAQVADCESPGNFDLILPEGTQGAGTTEDPYILCADALIEFVSEGVLSDAGPNPGLVFMIYPGGQPTVTNWDDDPNASNVAFSNEGTFVIDNGTATFGMIGFPLPITVVIVPIIVPNIDNPTEINPDCTGIDLMYDYPAITFYDPAINPECVGTVTPECEAEAGVLSTFYGTHCAGSVFNINTSGSNVGAEYEQAYAITDTNNIIIELNFTGIFEPSPNVYYFHAINTDSVGFFSTNPSQYIGQNLLDILVQLECVETTTSSNTITIVEPILVQTSLENNCEEGFYTLNVSVIGNAEDIYTFEGTINGQYNGGEVASIQLPENMEYSIMITDSLDCPSMMDISGTIPPCELGCVADAGILVEPQADTYCNTEEFTVLFNNAIGGEYIQLYIVENLEMGNLTIVVADTTGTFFLEPGQYFVSVVNALANEIPPLDALIGASIVDFLPTLSCFDLGQVNGLITIQDCSIDCEANAGSFANEMFLAPSTDLCVPDFFTNQTPTLICPEFELNHVIGTCESTFDCGIEIQDDSLCFTYLPLPALVGLDDVTVIGCDDLGGCDTIVYSINIGCFIPQAVDDEFYVSFGDTSWNIDVLANDIDECNYNLSITEVSTPSDVEVIINENNTLTINNNLEGPFSLTFNYTICNECGECDEGSIYVVAIEESPNVIGTTDFVTTDTETTINIDVLANDFDVDGDSLYIFSITTLPNLGTASINNGEIIYNAGGMVGNDTLEYLVCSIEAMPMCTYVNVFITVGNTALLPIDSLYCIDDTLMIATEDFNQTEDYTQVYLLVENDTIQSLSLTGEFILEEGNFNVFALNAFTGEIGDVNTWLNQNIDTLVMSFECVDISEGEDFLVENCGFVCEAEEGNVNSTNIYYPCNTMIDTLCIPFICPDDTLFFEADGYNQSENYAQLFLMLNDDNGTILDITTENSFYDFDSEIVYEMASLNILVEELPFDLSNWLGQNYEDVINALTCFDIETLGSIEITCNLFCFSDAGTLAFAESVHCNNEEVWVNATDFNQETDYLQTYLLMNADNSSLINVSESGNLGTLNSGMYQAYALNYLETDAPNIEVGMSLDELMNQTTCFDLSEAATVHILKPLEISADYECDPLTGVYTMAYAFSGGLPAYVQEYGSLGIGGETFYNATGDVDGNYILGENILVEYVDNTPYNISVNDQVGCFTEVSALPAPCIKTAIELVEFKGEVEAIGNRLYWVTASETDNQYFEIERSWDGQHFEALTKVEAVQNSHRLTTYEWIDQTLKDGLYYYRLKSVDFDGKTEKSSIILLDRSSQNLQNLSLSPIPTRDILNIQFQTIPNAFTYLEIFDVSGKKVYQESINATSNFIHKTLNIQTWNTGMYFIKIQNTQTTITKRIIKE